MQAARCSTMARNDCPARRWDMMCPVELASCFVSWQSGFVQGVPGLSNCLLNEVSQPRRPLASGKLVPCTAYLDQMVPAGREQPVAVGVPGQAGHGGLVALQRVERAPPRPRIPQLDQGVPTAAGHQALQAPLKLWAAAGGVLRMAALPGRCLCLRCSLCLCTRSGCAAFLAAALGGQAGTARPSLKQEGHARPTCAPLVLRALYIRGPHHARLASNQVRMCSQHHPSMPCTVLS